MTACATASSEALPPIIPYAPEVQAKAAAELESMPPACPPDGIVADCSAVKRLVQDYKLTRDKLRAAQ